MKQSSVLDSLRSRPKRKVPLILQCEANECGQACLAMIAAGYGFNTRLKDIRVRFPPPPRGTSVKHLIEIGQAIGFRATAFRIEPEQLGHIQLPCIVHIDLVHYVVLESIGKSGFQVVDPGAGRQTLSAKEFDRRFTGICIELRKCFSPALPGSRRVFGTLRLLGQGLSQNRQAIAATLAIALLLEISLMVSPLLIQVVTDSILPSSDIKLLWLVASAFSLLALAQAVFSACRSALLIRIGSDITINWNSMVGAKLLQLPLDFFLRRSVADLHSRFRSIDAVQRILTGKLIESILDAATILFFGAMLAFYSWILTLLTVGALSAYVALRMFTLEKMQSSEQREILASAAQHGVLMEMLSAIGSIKAGGMEALQLARYEAKTSLRALAIASIQGHASAMNASAAFIWQLHRILVIAVGASMAISGDLTVGMLVAYLAYALLFTEKGARFIDLVVDLKLLNIHTERLADITDSAPVRVGSEPIRGAGSLAIEIRNVTFAYGPDELPIIAGCSFTLSPGECVAIVGRSGCGKSTLAKLIGGLLQPISGDICYNGTSTSEIDTRLLRRQVACVLQDDSLFNGTLFENIASFEPNFERELVVEVAKLAQIDDFIRSMPMGYETKIVDMGATFSGGQRQRIILARALYRRPLVLILDEASSHLDPESERLVNEAIMSMNITRIIIAHRAETIRLASRVFMLSDGVMTETQTKRLCEDAE